MKLLKLFLLACVASARDIRPGFKSWGDAASGGDNAEFPPEKCIRKLRDRALPPQCGYMGRYIVDMYKVHSDNVLDLIEDASHGPLWGARGVVTGNLIDVECVDFCSECAPPFLLFLFLLLLLPSSSSSSLSSPRSRSGPRCGGCGGGDDDDDDDHGAEGLTVP